MAFFQLSNLLENRRSNQNTNDRLALRFPTPETQYPYYKLDTSLPNKCINDCPQQYCLQDLCLTAVMAETHFPTSRPVSIPVGDTDRHISFKP